MLAGKTPQFRDRIRVLDLYCKGGLDKNSSIHYCIKIKIRLVIVNKMNLLVIQGGSLRGGRMEKLGCRFLALCPQSTYPTEINTNFTDGRGNQ